MIGPFDAVYASIMLAAVAVGAALARGPQRRLALSLEQRVGVGVGAFCGAMIGAKLPFALADWRNLVSGGAWFADGKTIVFGLVGGYLGVETAKWAFGVRTKTGDSFAPGVAAAVAVGRLACLRAGCCFGTPTDAPWGFVFPHIDNQPRHPTQLYESFFHACMALLLWRLRWRGLLPGQLMKLYLLTYFAYRFLTEMIRPEARLIGGLTVYQYACLALAPIFVMLWRRDARTTAGQPGDHESTTRGLD